MTVQVTVYRSDSGAVFDHEFDALKDDLATLLRGCDGTNDAIIVGMVTHMTGERDKCDGLARTLRALSDAHPTAPMTVPQ